MTPEAASAGGAAVAPGGYRLATLPVLGALVVALAAAVLVDASMLPWVVFAALLCGLLGAGSVMWFHRDPDRSVPEHGVLAPADGTVMVVREEDDGRIRVGTFMSPLDVHVNRSPVTGRVDAVTHEPGGHWPAFSKASDRNERVRIAVGDYRLVLIAGAMARRIHPYVAADESVVRGERVAHISFGSRVDLVCPPSVDADAVAVAEGDPVVAGETVVLERDGDSSDG